MLPSLTTTSNISSQNGPNLDIGMILASVTPEAWERATLQMRATMAAPPPSIPQKRGPPPDDGARKRRSGPSAGSGHAAAASNAYVHGVGPVLASAAATVTVTPKSRVGAEARKSASTVKRKPRIARSLLWQHLVPFTSDIDPGPTHPSMISTSPVCTGRPDSTKFPFVLCRLCIIAEKRSWQPYSCCAGLLSTFGRHLASHHQSVYMQYREDSNKLPVRNRDNPFEMEIFHEKLARFIAVTDAALNIVECPEFRDLLTYISTHVEDEDIPHRTKLKSIIMDLYTTVHGENLARFKKDALGRLALAIDLWSTTDLTSILGVTGHYIARHSETRALELRSFLESFDQMTGEHSGKRCAAHLFTRLKKDSLLEYLSIITCDNESKNNTFMDEFADLLEAEGIPFDRNGNRVRCFPHVINIAVQHVLASLTDSACLLETVETDDAARNELYGILKSDVVKQLRDLVSACRASGQRREALTDWIKNGNLNGIFVDADGKMLELRVVQLLRDVETRWSSTYLMIERVLELYPAIYTWGDTNTIAEVRKHLLTQAQLEVLDNIAEILLVPHQAQEVMSAEKTPTLSMALPLYELLIKRWMLMKESKPLYAPFIDIGIKKIQEYIELSRKSKIYALAIVLNPGSRLAWIRENWSETEASDVRQWVLDAMLSFRKDAPPLTSPSVSPSSLLSAANPSDAAASTPLLAAPPTPASSQSRTRALPHQTAAAAQQRGIQRIKSGLADQLRALETSKGLVPDPTPDSVSTPPTAAQREAASRELVDAELCRYEALRLPAHIAVNDGVDLLRFWDLYHSEFPHLFRIAMDVLAAQASAVSCERLFSSAARTDILDRNRMEPPLLQALQTLKFTYKSQRRTDMVSFVEGLITTEEELL